MGMSEKLSKSKSSTMINTVMKKVDDMDMDGKKRNIPLDQIDMNEDNGDIFGYQDIDYLAMTVDENGFNGAIEVWAKPDGRYEISSGHRRYLAMQKLGKKEIPCIVYEDVSDEIKAKKLVLSNVHNRKLTPLRTARAINYYKKNVLHNDGELTEEARQELMREFNVKKATLYNLISLTKMIPEFQECVDTPDCHYTNYLPVSKLDVEQQRRLYATLKELADKSESGNMNSLSSVVIEQYARKIYEQDKKEEEMQRKKLYGTEDGLPETISRAKETKQESSVPEPVFETVNEKIIGDETSAYTTFQNNDNSVSHSEELEYMENISEDYPVYENDEGTDEEAEDDGSMVGNGRKKAEIKYLLSKLDDLVTTFTGFSAEEKQDCIDRMRVIMIKMEKSR